MTTLLHTLHGPGDRTENPGVGGAIPSLPTISFTHLPVTDFFQLMTGAQRHPSPGALLAARVATGVIYPSPLRAVGEIHSLNECFTTTGTMILMMHFDDIGEPQKSVDDINPR